MSNKIVNNVHRVSRLFQPVKPMNNNTVRNIKETESKSYRLMMDMGIIRTVNTGMYSLLPLGHRVLSKLIAIVDTEMTNVGAQKMMLPHLTSAKLWETTGRYEEMGPELFKVLDRHSGRYILSPTYEEAITKLVAAVEPTQHQLPLLLYQISNKWRDEKRPKLGFIRSREFIMKDLYSFDLSVENAEKTYKAVHEAYNNILSHIDLPYTVTIGDTGVMGGSFSHEYHCLSEIGEDTVLSCTSCGLHANSSVCNESTCNNCQKELVQNRAIEVGHTFMLGTKYSETFEATCRVNDIKVPLVMGCFGLGLTRIIAAAVEILSTNDELRWPKKIAPYTVCIIPPKHNSKESPATQYAEEVIDILHQRNIDYIIDDRMNWTIGKRIMSAKMTGYPYLIVVGKAAMQPTPLLEVHDVNSDGQMNMSVDGLADFFGNFAPKHHERKQAIV